MGFVGIYIFDTQSLLLLDQNHPSVGEGTVCEMANLT